MQGVHASPLSQCCVYSTYSHKIYQFPPIFAKFLNVPHIFFQLSVLLNLRLLSPYLDYDLFMHYALHVGLLDASGSNNRTRTIEITN